MTTYALMKNPAYSRVSFLGSDALAINELTTVVSKSSTISAKNIRLSKKTELGGISYILFDCDNALSESAITIISR